jgi:hypothetical protein
MISEYEIRNDVFGAQVQVVSWQLSGETVERHENTQLRADVWAGI